MSRNPQVIVLATFTWIALCASVAAYAKSDSGGNYENCVGQKTAVAQTYCNAHGTDCTAEIQAAKRECRTEVRKGLRFSYQ